MDFSQLLKQASNVDQLKEAIEKEQSGFQKDTSFWTPTLDKAGNGFAVFRFLMRPPQDGDDGLPYVKYFSHGFQGPTGLWYIENSLTTLGKDDPVGQLNSRLWQSGLESNKDIARKQKRKLNYVANIYMINDHGNPENNGKNFRYRFGKKIFEKIEAALNPAKYDPAAVVEGKVGFDPFHFIQGANFKLKVRTIGEGQKKYPNYDNSAFDAPTPLLGGDPAKLEAVWRAEFSLKELVAPDKFKDYATLKNRLDQVLGYDTGGGSAAPVAAVTSFDNPATLIKASTAEGIDLGNDDDPELFANLAKD